MKFIKIMIFQFKLSRSNSFNSLSLPALLGNPNFHGNIGLDCKFRFIFKVFYLEQSGKAIALRGYSLIWPIRGFAAGQGIVLVLSLLNRVYNFARIRPKQGICNFLTGPAEAGGGARRGLTPSFWRNKNNNNFLKFFAKLVF